MEDAALFLNVASGIVTIIAGLGIAVWIWVSYKNKGPLGLLEKRLREDWNGVFARLERYVEQKYNDLDKKAEERHETLCKKADRIDRNLENAFSIANEARVKAAEARAMAMSALREGGKDAGD